MNRITWSTVAAVALILSLTPTAKADTLYTQTNLVSNVPGLALTTDPNLVNPWGVANNATSPYWVSDQGTGKATLYNGAGTPTALVVTIPPTGTTPPQGPTGQVFNFAGAGNFVLSDGTAATFLFATLAGTIDGWNGGEGTTAVQAASTPAAVYTGLALASNGSGNFLFAANFASGGGGIQVFNSSFANVTGTTFAGKFVDPHPIAGYAPYNVQLIGGNLYVTYAVVGAQGATTGAGLGYVDVFDTSGNFIQRIATGGPLNAPWGITIAPSGFGTFSNDLLVGNFGSGEIDAFNPVTNSFVGTLDSAPGVPLVNSGLWALEFENSNTGSTPNTLLFTAGIDGETDGLVGSIQATPEPSSLILLATGLLGIVGGVRRRRR